VVEPRTIEDEEELTQYGTTTEPFRNEPRWWKEQAVSLIAGGWHPLAAAQKVRGFALEDGTDAARYAKAGALRAAGFTVAHKPTKRNDDHVSVSRADWDAKAFDDCFGDVEVAEMENQAEEDEDE
jgi:hypothetical protein